MYIGADLTGFMYYGNRQQQKTNYTDDLMDGLIYSTSAISMSRAAIYGPPGQRLFFDGLNIQAAAATPTP